MKTNRIPWLVLTFFLVGCNSISMPDSMRTQVEPTSTITPLTTNTFQPSEMPEIFQIPILTITPESTVQEITTTLNDNQIILKGFTSGLISWLSWSKDGKTLFIETLSKGVMVYDMVNKKVTAYFETGSFFQKLALSPDGKTLAIANDNSIYLVNSETGALMNTLHLANFLNYWVEGLSFSPDSKILAVGNDRFYSEITLWDVATGDEIEQLFKGDSSTRELYQIRTLLFSPDGGAFTADFADGTIMIWNTTTWELHRTFQCQYSGISSFSPDGNRFAVFSLGTDTKGGSVWDFKSCKKLFNLNGAQSWVTEIAFDPNGKYIAANGMVGGGDRTIHTITIWDANTGKHIRDLVTGNNLSEVTLAFSPDGTQLASAWGQFDRGEVVIWNLNRP